MRFRIVACVAALIPAGLTAQAALPASQQTNIDNAVRAVLKSTGAPSASIAVVCDGNPAYAQAYGIARLTPSKPATPDMRYSIGSISKQFTATALLLLVEERKVSLDDKVGKWLPQLTRANDVTMRELLSMTSGYQDYWPQDYVMPAMLKPATAQSIVDGWAKKPLDFEPETKWQYSNTNYVIAGMIIEKASGMPLIDFLQKRVFTPLKMNNITNIDDAPLGADDPVGYLRYALAAPRPAPKEGKGWLYAAGELAMTASDLAAWDISILKQSVLTPASYHTQQTEVLLKNGASTHYGLGVSVNLVGGRRQIAHGGEVSGYTARNEVYPDDGTAIVVFVNLDATGASATIAGRIATILFTANDAETQKATEQAKKIFADLQRGHIERPLFSDNANAYFSAQAVNDFASSLGPLGKPTEFSVLNTGLRGGMTLRTYRVRCGAASMTLTTFILPDGKIEQFQVARTE